MPVYRYDTKLKQMVQISEKSYRNSTGHLVDRPMAEQVMEGYKRLEARGERTYGNPAEIKRLWSK
jgi:hypothetical protein